MTNNSESNAEPNLQTLRQSAGYTQERLSRETGLSKSTIGFYESGVKLPRIDNFVQIARCLGVSLKTLAKAMGINVENISDDGLSLAELKALCRELKIEQIEELPDDFSQLIHLRRR
jgi:transcriptional regulator with XRE-family HTH domain